MMWTIVAVHDRATDSFNTPQAFKAKGEAIRAFQDAVNNPQSGTMHQHPEDYDLYYLGEYDDHRGEVHPEDKPVQIAIGKNAKVSA